MLSIMMTAKYCEILESIKTSNVPLILKVHGKKNVKPKNSTVTFHLDPTMETIF